MKIENVEQELKDIKSEKRRLIDRQKEIKNELESTKRQRLELIKIRSKLKSHINVGRKDIRDQLRSIHNKFFLNSTKEDCDNFLTQLKSNVNELTTNIHKYFYCSADDTSLSDSTEEVELEKWEV